MAGEPDIEDPPAPKVEQEEEQKNEESPEAEKEAAPAPAPAAPEFSYINTAREVHGLITHVKGFKIFFLKWLLLQTVKIAGNLSFLVLAIIIKDFTAGGLSDTDIVGLVVVGVLNIAARIVPPILAALVDKLKVGMQVDMSVSIVKKLFELEHNAVLSTPTGEFAQLLSKVFMNLSTMLPAMYGNMFGVLLETFVGVVVIAIFFGWIAAIQLVLVLCYTWAAFQAGKAAADRNKDMMMAMFSEWGKILDTASSYEKAHFFDNVKYEINKARSAFNYMGHKIDDVTMGSHKSTVILNAVSLIITAGFVCLIVFVDDVSDGKGGLEVAALLFYFFNFVGGLEMYAKAHSELRAGLVEYQTLQEFVNRRSGIEDVEGAIELQRTKNPSIEFKNVSFSYGQRQILDDVSFKIEGGRTLGLVGESGCGKSTIMRLLLRFYRASSGTILVDGHDITQVTGRSLRQLFSVVTQDASLSNVTIRDNICYGKMGSSDEEILRAASLAELQINDSDLSLDKVCGEKGAKLSGGQQQRVALARAMLKNGSIYLLDEPTTGLDGQTAKQLQTTLDDLATHATSIMITHHLEDLRRADQILYLDGGKVVERGTYEQLQDSQGAFYQQTQARKRGGDDEAGGGAAAAALEQPVEEAVQMDV